MPIQLRIITGDARQIQTDVLVCGDRNTFLRDLEVIEEKQLEQDDKFQIYTCGAAHKTCKIIHPQRFPFHTVVAFHIVSRNPTSKNAFKEKSFRPLIEGMNYVVKELAPNELTFLPFSWRNPLFVAIGTIYAIWFSVYRLAYYLSRPHFKVTRNSITRYTIISETGTDCYKEVLDNNCQVLKEYVKKYPDCLYWLDSIMEHEEPELTTSCYEMNTFITHYTLGKHHPRKFEL